jgi:hypothetical protein
MPEQGTFKLFSSEATGIAVRLRGWRYPVVFDTAAGQARFDNFGGRWGDQSEFALFHQSYAIEVAKLQARRRGHSVTEQLLADGSIKLTVQVGGAS